MVAYTSVMDGDWDDNATWGALSYPQNGDTATIRHHVTVRTDVEVGIADTNYNVSLDAADSLLDIVPGLVDIEFKMHGNISIQRGLMTIGTEAVPVPAGRTVRLWMADGGRTIRLHFFGPPYAGGAFECWGSPSYHMNNETCQRTQLLNAVVPIPATPVTFETTDDVGWSVGDTVWVGTGCDKTVTPTTCEKVVIATKTSDHEYTAIFVYDHAANDFIVQGERNIIIDGNAAANGFVIFTNPLAGQPNIYRLRLDWTKLLYGGVNYGYMQSAINVYLDGALTTTHVLADKYRVTNCLFDSAGNNGVAGAIAFDTNRTVDDSDVMFHDTHFYGQYMCFNYVQLGVRPGVYKHDNMTAINCNFFCYSVDAIGTAQLEFDELWYSGVARTTNSCYIFFNVLPISLTNFKLVNSYQVAFLVR